MLDTKSAIDITLERERIGESRIIPDGTDEIQTRLRSEITAYAAIQDAYLD